MDGKPKPKSESSLGEAYLTREEVACPILTTRPTNTNSFRELKSILKPSYGISVQPARLPEGVESPSGPSLDDNPVSSSLDLTSDILLASPSNQASD